MAWNGMKKVFLTSHKLFWHHMSFGGGEKGCASANE